MSELRTNSIVPRNGLPIGAAGGGIIQVVQVVETAQYTVTGYNFTTVMSASIIPSRTSNKILVMLDANIGCTQGFGAMLNLLRNSTQIYFGDQVAGQAPQVSKAINTYEPTYGVYHQVPTQLIYLDSPNVENVSVTYNIQLASHSSTFSAYLNRGPTMRNGDAADGGSVRSYDAQPASTLTLMEVTN